MSLTRQEFMQGIIVPSAFVILTEILATALFQVNRPILNWVVSQNLQTQPLGTSTTSQGISALLYVLPTVGLTFLIAWVIKRRPKRLIPILVLGTYAVSSFFIFVLGFWWLPTWSWLAVAIGYVVFVLSAMGRLHYLARLPFQVYVGVGTAVMLVLILPSFMLVVMAGVMASWDVYAVMRGPLQTIATELKAQENKGLDLRGVLMLSLGRSSIGLGDIVFYSVMVMLATSFSLLAGALVFLGIGAGVFVTFCILRTHPRVALPGLPIPMLASILILALLGFL